MINQAVLKSRVTDIQTHITWQYVMLLHGTHLNPYDKVVDQCESGIFANSDSIKWYNKISLLSLNVNSI